MSDALQELHQIRDSARKVVVDGQRQVDEGTEVVEAADCMIAELEGGVTDAEAKRRRRGMGAISWWPLAGALAAIGEWVRTHQEAATAFGATGTAAASVAAAIVMQPAPTQIPQAPARPPRPVIAQPAAPTPPSTARAKPRPAEPAEAKPPPVPAEPTPEPTPTETTPTETTLPADATADHVPSAGPPAPKVKPRPKVPKVGDECLTDVAVSGNVDCLNG